MQNNIDKNHHSDNQEDHFFRRATIDLTAIAANVRYLKNLAGVKEFIAVLKANAYGHGAVPVARAALAGGATRIGVADLDEALTLKHCGIDSVPILAWLHPMNADFQKATEAGIEVGVWSLHQLKCAAASAEHGRPLCIHLKVDSGLSRGGASPADWSALFGLAHHYEKLGILRVVGIFSHLSGASAQADLEQLNIFKTAVQTARRIGLRPNLLHIAATAATLSLPSTRLNAVRVGLGIYGLSPFEDQSSAELGLRPAMTLQASIAAVRRVPAGQGVSYGYDYFTTRETTLALVPLGYADGIPRQASGLGKVLIAGRQYSSVGRVAMDQFIVDVGDADVSVGDPVVVFGDPQDGAPPADQWAKQAGTINYELVTRIGPRVQRSYRTIVDAVIGPPASNQITGANHPQGDLRHDRVG